MTEEKFSQWAIIEMFGHQRIAGLVTEQQLGGCSFVRVDVPGSGERSAFTKLLGQGAIYAVNFVSEEVARQAAKSFRAEPVSVYDLPALRQTASLPSTFDSDPEDFNEDPR